MIVVTTPTGNIGHHVGRHLLEASEPIRLIARELTKLLHPFAIGSKYSRVRIAMLPWWIVPRAEA
jgi:hypothetical protein